MGFSRVGTLVPFLFFIGLFLRSRLFNPTRNYDPTCEAALHTGSWRTFPSAWSPDGCFLHSYHTDLYDIDRCFADYSHDIHYIFAGDSTARQVFWGMVDLIDNKLGNGNYSSYQSQRHSNFHLTFPRHPSTSDSQSSDSSIYFSFIWDPFFNSSAIYELQKYSAAKNTPIAVVYTSIGLWFSRHFSDDQMYNEFSAATNRLSYSLYELHSTLPTRKGARKDGQTTYDNSRAHSLFLSPVLYPYPPLLTPDRAKDMTYSRLRPMNRIINERKSLTKIKDDKLSELEWIKIQKHHGLANVNVPTIFNTFTKDYPQGHDKMGIHFNKELSTVQALLLTNLRCNSALSHSFNSVPPHHPKNAPVKSRYDYPNYQACCAGPAPRNESATLWCLVAFLLVLSGVIKPRNDTRNVNIALRTIAFTAVQSLLWVAIFLTIKTGITGVKREVANQSDIIIILMAIAVFSLAIMKQKFSSKLKPIIKIKAMDNSHNIVKGFLFVVYCIVFGMLPDLSVLDVRGNLPVNIYWALANCLAAFFLYGACKLGKSASYIMLYYLKSATPVTDGFDFESVDKANAYLATFKLSASSVVGLESVATYFLGSSYLVRCFLGVLKTLYYILINTCGPILLISLINIVPDLGLIKKSHSLSQGVVPVLSYTSEYHFAVMLFAVSTITCLFFFTLLKLDHTKQFRHPHEIAQGTSKIGFKADSYMKFSLAFGILLVVVQLVFDWGVSKIVWDRNVKYTHFVGLELFTFFSFATMQYFYLCDSVKQGRLLHFVKKGLVILSMVMIMIKLGLFFVNQLYLNYQEETSEKIESIKNYLHLQNSNAVHIFDLRISQLLMSVIFAGVIIATGLRASVPETLNKFKSRFESNIYDKDALSLSVTGIEDSEFKSHSRSYSRSFSRYLTHNTSESQSLDYADLTSTNGNFKEKEKRFSFSLSRTLFYCTSLLLVIGQYSFELILLILLVFNIPIFQYATPQALQHLAEISHYYWTIPRIFATHGSFFVVQVLDSMLVVAMLVQAAKSLAGICGRYVGQ